MAEITDKGFYIVGEGNDGTGKSTQIDLLANYFANELNLKTYVMHEPDGCPISSEIRNIIKNGSLSRSAVTNLSLFTASRYETWQSEALPVLQENGVVLSARNEFSTEVYQGIAEGLGVDYVRKITSLFMDERYMNPDLMVIFTLNKLAREQRVINRGELKNPDTFESRGDDFQNMLDDGYLKLASERNIQTVSAEASAQQVQQVFRHIALSALVAKGVYTSPQSC